MSHPTMSADELRSHYATLREDVSRAVNIPLRTARLPGGMAAIRSRVVDFMAVAVQSDWVLQNRIEQETLRSNLQRMLQYIDNPPAHAQDLPEPAISFHNPRERHAPRRPGRPRLSIDPALLQDSITRRPQTTLAENFGCHPRTIRRRLLEFGLAEKSEPVFLDQVGVPRHAQRLTTRNPASRRTVRLRHTSDVELDTAVADILTVFPSFGRRFVTGQLRDRGLYATQKEIRASISRVTGRTRPFRRNVQRRVYRVAGPNSLWHHDGQHGLIRWKIVIHAFIDGYSRFVTGIRASDNNRASTVLELFDDSCQRLNCVPRRVRGDCGLENLAVAERMAQLRDPQSYIWGRSVDNIRIERLWVDVVRGVVDKWYSFFCALEWEQGLDPRLPSHIWLLHHLYLPLINQELSQWADTWNLHPMDIAPDRRLISRRTAECPRDMFLYGMLANGPRGYDIAPATQDQEDANAQYLDEYGIDWAALEDQEILRSNILNNGGVDEGPIHFGPHRPTRFSRVDVLPPRCPLSQEGLDALDSQLRADIGLDFSLRDMRERKIWWSSALYLLQDWESRSNVP